jgi:hypothetical protein
LVQPQRRWRLWVPEWQQSAALWQEEAAAPVALAAEDPVAAAEQLRQEAEQPVVAELVGLRRPAARHRHLPRLLEVVLMAE